MFNSIVSKCLFFDNYIFYFVKKSGLMKQMRLIIFLFLTGCIFQEGYAFLDRDTHILTMEDGLADNKVNCIYKDDDGFMWFGTSDGLSLYDGTQFKNFFVSSMPYSYIHQIDKLSESYIALRSGNEVFAFNRKKEQFVPICYGGEIINYIQFIHCSDSSFWAVEKNRISLVPFEEKQDSVSIELGKIETILESSDASFVCAYYTQVDRKLYIIDDSWNLYDYDVARRSLSRTVKLPSLPGAQINSILDANGIIWVTTIAGGIIMYHKDTEKISHLNYGDSNSRMNLSHTDIYGLIPIDNNRLMAITWNGYTIIHSKDSTFDDLHTSIYNNVTLESKDVEIRMISACYDNRGIIWIGTYGGGIVFSDLRQQFYDEYKQDRHNEICGITVDDEGFLWLASFHKGIMKSKSSFNTMEPLQFQTVGQPQTILCIKKDSKGNLWFGGQEGTLSSFKSGTLEKYVLRTGGRTNTETIWDILVENDECIWVGTDDGVLQFDAVTGICKSVEKDRSIPSARIQVHSLVKSKDGRIWTGTLAGGLCVIERNELRPVHIKDGNVLNNYAIHALCVSSDKHLFVGTDMGLGVIDLESESLVAFYTTKDGLCSNFIRCIEEDEKGQIWIGSNSGISRYSRHQHLFYNYYISGSNRSSFLYHGFLFWGNNKSLVYFNPDRLDIASASDEAIITGLEIGNKLVGLGEEVNGQVILSQNLYHTEEVKLNSRNRDFALTFGDLSYSSQRSMFRYRLYPYQQEWMLTNKREKVSYANLPKGNYIFELENLYPDERTGKRTVLHIVLLPHWTETWYFRALMGAIVLLVVGWIIRRIQIRQSRMEHELQLEQEVFAAKLERDNEKQIRLEREHFFTNTSHELRTPLTLINAPLQEVMATLEPTGHIYEKLSLMSRNVQSLNSIVERLLYVQKMEAGLVKLNLSQADIVEVVRNISLSFSELASLNGYDYQVSLPAEPIPLWIDVEKISSVIQNLLSNAFKYTPKGGSVSCSVDKTVIDDTNYARIIVADSGVGIEKDFQEHVFDSFVTGGGTPTFSSQVGVGLRIVKKTMDLHHGIILLESKVNKGTTVTLLIHEGCDHFREDGYDLVEEKAKQKEEIPDGQDKEGQTSLLIIEDNQEMRSYIKNLFSKQFVVFEAEDGEDGVRVAIEKVPNVIISDVMMPRKDGFACCKEIKETAQTAHIPILMLTAKSEDADILHSTRIGVDDFMMKPFNPEILRSKVNNLIHQRERLKRIYTKALMLKQQAGVDEKDAFQNEFIQRIIHIIEANLANDAFNVKSLAEQMNMSQPTLYRKLKQHTDIAAIDLIRSIRMSKAASYIMENRYSIQEIAELVGYNDVRTLRKHFVDQFGVPPSKYMNL